MSSSAFAGSTPLGGQCIQSYSAAREIASMWSQISYGSIVFGATLKDRDPSCDGWVLVQPYARVASGRGRFRMQSVYSNDLELLRLFQRGIGAAAAKTAEIGMSAKIIHSEIGDTEYELLPYVVIR